MKIGRWIKLANTRVALIHLLCLVSTLSSFSQLRTIQGKVTDAGSGDPIPFVNVYLKGTQAGATTDFDGNYSFKTDLKGDSIVAANVS